ncbi:MAG: GIY-YIG nuclease family protein [Bacteroidetes bacterium]|nr:GIY-YIG nuclease family protein [Bacteroidota bacterium]
MSIIKRYWVYILLCSDGSYYTGMTSDLENRMIEHYHGRYPGYTSTRRPVTLVFSEEFSDASLAAAFERQVKGWSRAKKESLIRRDMSMLHILAECKNSSHSSNYRMS